MALGLVVACGKSDEVSDRSPNSKANVTLGIAKPLESELAGYVQVDRVDIGNDADEKAHGYSIDSQTFAGTHQFDSPKGKVSYLETGRANKSFETFRVKVTPSKDHLLVRAFDTLAKDQRVAVTANGKKLGDWSLPDGGDSRYGESTFLIPKTAIGDQPSAVVRLDYVSGMPDTNAFVYWIFAKTSTGIPTPLKTDLAGVALVDQLDVGDVSDEAAHQYLVDRPTFEGTHQFDGTWGTYSETGRATKSFESFKLKVTPGRDHVLVKAFDTLSRDQKTRVSIDGKMLGSWNLPNDDSRYAESTFEIPKEAIGDKKEITVRIDFVSASMDMNSFVYWLYARTRAAGLTRPLLTDVRALTLVDRLDVGNDADERMHAYAIDKQTFVGTHEFVVDGQTYLENGRATKSFETFRISVRPNVDNILVKAFDTLSKDQKVRVVFGGKPVGEWSFPNGSQRYSEATFRLPAALISGLSKVTLRLEYLAGSIDTNSFVIWVFAKPGEAN